MTRILLCLAAALPGFGASITLDAAASGRYFDTGTFESTSYGTGWHAGVPGEARSYFGFDLSGVTGSIVSATLRLETAPSFAALLSPTGAETFGVFDVSVPLGTLTSGAGAGSFGDLGSGTLLGSFGVTDPVGQFVDIPLNGAGIAYLNGLGGGTAVLGGALTTLAKGAGNEIVFNATNAGLARQLLVETDGGAGVPEPGTWGLVGGGLVLAVMGRRRV